MAPKANLDALVAMVKGEERLGRWKMDLDRNSNFNKLNADWDWGVQFQVRFFLVKSIRGRATLE